MARSFQLHGPVRQQNQRILLRLRKKGSHGIPVRIGPRTGKARQPLGGPLGKCGSHAVGKKSGGATAHTD